MVRIKAKQTAVIPGFYALLSTSSLKMFDPILSYSPQGISLPTSLCREILLSLLLYEEL